jgi:hypothetical protein
LRWKLNESPRGQIGGNATTGLATALGGGLGAAGTVGGRIVSAAAQGGAQGALQGAATSTEPGKLWWDTAKGSALGAVLGTGVGSLVEGAMPFLRAGMAGVRSLFSGAGNASTAAVPAAADQVVKQALSSAGVDASTIDLNLLKGMRTDVQSALDHGADISPTSIVNRARAESLPIPVQLMRGQATRDPILFSREQNISGITGVGEPITGRLQQQNQAFLDNLDALGAKGAMNPVDLGNHIASNVQSMWDNLQAHKTALYNAVRNSQGQSAGMDGITAADNIHAALNTPQASYAFDLLPSNIKRTIEDLRSGNVPFSVAQMQSLDKQWGDAARGTDNGSVADAINTARRILGNAPIADDAGEASRQAYMAARQAHAQQMSLIDPKLPNGQPNPNFQPVVKSVVMDGTAPEKLFDQYFMKAPPSVAAKNAVFLQSIDSDAQKLIGQTFMGEIKRKAIQSASDPNAPVSESVLRG